MEMYFFNSGKLLYLECIQRILQLGWYRNISKCQSDLNVDYYISAFKNLLMISLFSIHERLYSAAL